MIIVNPWEYGITFSRYYHGQVPWNSVPPIRFLRYHRYDLLKEQMTAVEPMKPLEQQIGQVLRGGGKVWLVGQLRVPTLDEPRSAAAPAPGTPYGWSEGFYSQVWEQQLGCFFRDHAQKGTGVRIGSNQTVSYYETASLIMLEGWRP